MRLSTLALFLAIQTASASNLRKNFGLHRTRALQTPPSEPSVDSPPSEPSVDSPPSEPSVDSLEDLEEEVEDEIEELEEKLKKLDGLLDDTCANQSDLDAALADANTCELGKYAVQDDCEVECEDCFPDDEEPCLIDDMDVIFTVPGSCDHYTCECEDGKTLDPTHQACV